jgi:hypothetical protein
LVEQQRYQQQQKRIDNKLKKLGGAKEEDVLKKIGKKKKVIGEGEGDGRKEVRDGEGRRGRARAGVNDKRRTRYARTSPTHMEGVPWWVVSSLFLLWRKRFKFLAKLPPFFKNNSPKFPLIFGQRVASYGEICVNLCGG